MKKFARIALILLTALLLLSLVGCSSSRYADGTYTASLAEFEKSGWKDFVELTIKDGKIAAINWDSVYQDDSIPIKKKQYSKSGLYGMLAAGAVGEWYDQATAAEQFVLENGIDALGVDSEGYTDAVTGCTVHVNTFEKLVRECLAQAEK